MFQIGSNITISSSSNNVPINHDGQPYTEADQPHTYKDDTSFQHDTIPIDHSYNPWNSRVSFLYERPTMETHCCRIKKEERVWHDGMRNCEGLKVFIGKFFEERVA